MLATFFIGCARPDLHHALKTVEHRGGLDAFLAKAKTEELSQNARELKREIAKKQAGAATA